MILLLNRVIQIISHLLQPRPKPRKRRRDKQRSTQPGRRNGMERRSGWSKLLFLPSTDHKTWYGFAFEGINLNYQRIKTLKSKKTEKKSQKRISRLWFCSWCSLTSLLHFKVTLAVPFQKVNRISCSVYQTIQESCAVIPWVSYDWLIFFRLCRAGNSVDW